ncbi:MAG: nucleotidyltransferase family protein [Caulobacterales bacterium]|nr:nucleotidyltransferase family protein [Caulobacterales bacterium]
MPNRPATLWCVILAAGASHRLGRPKQLIAHRGRPLLLHAADAATTLAPGRTVIVVGAHALRMRALLTRHAVKAAVVANPEWQTGMASSLRVGLRYLPKEAAAALLMLSDQPRVDGRSLNRLVKAWIRKPSAPAAAFFAGRLNAPAILPRRFWGLVRGLTGDVGARAVLRETGAHTTPVQMPEAVLDIDTAEDLKRL